MNTDLHDDVVYCLLAGWIPVEAVDMAMLPLHCHAVLKAVRHLQVNGESPPHDPWDVWKIAKLRFHAGEDTENTLYRCEERSPPGRGVRTAVRERLIMQAVVQQASQQLATGEVDVLKLQNLLTGTDNIRGIQIRASAPPMAREGKYFCRTFPEIDAVIGGLKQELIIVAGEAKVGKTTFLSNWVLANLDKKCLYITVADNDYDDLMDIWQDIDPPLVDGRAKVVDFTACAPTMGDIEEAVRKFRPHLLIVDRSEEMAGYIPGRQEPRFKIKEIARGLRLLAKRYACCVITDAQKNVKSWGREKSAFESLSEEKVGRAALVDLFFSMTRDENRIFLWIVGRRRGLPRGVKLKTNEFGRVI